MQAHECIIIITLLLSLGRKEKKVDKWEVLDKAKEWWINKPPLKVRYLELLAIAFVNFSTTCTDILVRS